MSYANTNGSYMLKNDEQQQQQQQQQQQVQQQQVQQPHQQLVVIRKPEYGMVYTIAHLIISLFAIYLSWKCNNGFNLLSFLIALFCPYLYIIYALATKGGCGAFGDTLTKPVQAVTP
jgi:hypothetical protein